MSTPFVHKFSKKIFPEWENLIKPAQVKFDSNNGNIPPSSLFTKKELIESNSAMYGWMADVNMKIVVPTGTIFPDYVPTEDIIEVDSLDIFLDMISANAPTGKYADKTMVALDLETTGLSPNWQLKNSNYDIDVKIVGVPLATSSTEGYYIPVMHTGDDDVPNFPYAEVIEFLTKLVNKHHIIYHNAQYDMGVLMNNGVIVDGTNLSDTMLINKLMNNWEYFEMWVRNGLKTLSKWVLKRNMLEISEILGVKKGGIVLFHRLPAVNAYIYAVSDACNTFGLYDAFVTVDKYGRNPYKRQPLATKILHRTVYTSNASLSYGLPVDFDRLSTSVKTVMIRIQTLQKRLNNHTHKYGESEISISSPMIGNFIVLILKSEWKGEDDKFYDFIDEYLKLSRKLTQLKGRVKEEFSTKDEIVSHLSGNIDGIEYLSDSTKADVKNVIELVSLFRTLNMHRSLYIGTLHSCFIDDRNTVLTPINLNISGTDTHRYSSSKGKGRSEYVSFHQLKTKVSTKVEIGNGLTPGLNSQGLPADSPTMKTMKKLTKIPAHIRSQLNIVNDKAENQIREDLAGIQAKKK